MIKYSRLSSAVIAFMADMVGLLSALTVVVLVVGVGLVHVPDTSFRRCSCCLTVRSPHAFSCSIEAQVLSIINVSPSTSSSKYYYVLVHNQYLALHI